MDNFYYFYLFLFRTRIIPFNCPGQIRLKFLKFEKSFVSSTKEKDCSWASNLMKVKDENGNWVPLKMCFNCPDIAVTVQQECVNECSMNCTQSVYHRSK